MRAQDIMTTRVTTVSPDTLVRNIAACLLEQHISGVPVADAEGRVVGIVTEGDLIHRVAASGERHRSWWENLFAIEGSSPAEFIKVHGLRAHNIMTRNVVTVTEDTPVEEVARILEKQKIKRVPVLRDGKLTGIVSRADLLRILVAAPEAAPVPVTTDDQTIRKRITAVLERQDWAHTRFLNVVVSDGVVHLWGLVSSDAERAALRVAAEEVPGVKGIEDHLSPFPNIDYE